MHAAGYLHVCVRRMHKGAAASCVLLLRLLLKEGGRGVVLGGWRQQHRTAWCEVATETPPQHRRTPLHRLTCPRPAPCCSAPTLLSVAPVGSTSGLACLKAPTLGGPWTGGFQCKSCNQGSCVPAPKCSLNPVRRLLATGCGQDSATCTLGDSLQSGTSYM